MKPPPTPAGWYPDPEGGPDDRYWDGQQWAPARDPDQHYPDEDYYPIRAANPAKPERTVRVSTLLRIAAAVVAVVIIGLFAWNRYEASQRVDVSALATQVKQSMQENLSNDDNYRKYGLKVIKVQLVKSGEHTFDGMAEVKPQRGESHLVGVKVTAADDSMWWETENGAFMWLATVDPA